MATYLAIGHPISQIGTDELFVAVSDLALVRQLTGAQESAVLDTLATAPRVGVFGAARDLLGRAGVADYSRTAEPQTASDLGKRADSDVEAELLMRD
jgi:hypothetical protein